jgi:hypothetical protein
MRRPRANSRGRKGGPHALATFQQGVGESPVPGCGPGSAAGVTTTARLSPRPARSKLLSGSYLLNTMAMRTRCTASARAASAAALRARSRLVRRSTSGDDAYICRLTRGKIEPKQRSIPSNALAFLPAARLRADRRS